MGFPQLAFELWGTGTVHAEEWERIVGTVCDKCNGRKQVGPTSLPALCPKCKGSGHLMSGVE